MTAHRSASRGSNSNGVLFTEHDHDDGMFEHATVSWCSIAAPADMHEGSHPEQAPGKPTSDRHLYRRRVVCLACAPPRNGGGA